MSLKVIIISGSIGAGKTSILKCMEALSEENNTISIFYENVESWKYYLDKFYNGEKNACTLLEYDIIMHYFSITKKIDQLEEQCTKDGKNRIIFIERSPFDVLHVFLKSNERLLTKQMYDTLCDMCKLLLSLNMHWMNAMHIYIHAPISYCLERIKIRNRGNENVIIDEYLKKLENYYYAYLDNIKNKKIIDNVGTLENLEHVARTVLSFINI